jgi:hypothetical protein
LPLCLGPPFPALSPAFSAWLAFSRLALRSGSFRFVVSCSRRTPVLPSGKGATRKEVKHVTSPKRKEIELLGMVKAHAAVNKELHYLRQREAEGIVFP